MSLELACLHLKKWGRENDIIEMPGSTATVELAAAAVGVEPGRIAKSLSFRHGDGALLVVAAGDAKVDNAKFRAAFGCKAKMLAPDEALRFTGHAVGGVCPFGLPPSLQVYLDVSLKRFDFVYPACGSSNSMIRLTLEELEQYSGAKGWIDVGKNWRGEEKAF